MKTWHKKWLLTMIALLAIGSWAEAKGHLVIIGGGGRPDYVMAKIIDLAGGPEAPIIIIPNASSDPLDAALYQRYHLERLGATNVNFVLFDSLTVNDPEKIQQVAAATGIFFSGGDQRVLARHLLGTAMLDRIRTIYEEGGVIAGTSAGAAVMSELMITGDELLNTDPERAFETIQKGNMELTRGFGFMKTAIVDQHFIVRRRENRLFSIMLEHPDLIGIGIDEQTAIIVKPDDTLEVLGESIVMIIDPTNAANIRTDKNNNFSAGNIAVHLLQSGQQFDLKTNSLVP